MVLAPNMKGPVRRSLHPRRQPRRARPPKLTSGVIAHCSQLIDKPKKGDVDPGDFNVRDALTKGS